MFLGNTQNIVNIRTVAAATYATNATAAATANPLVANQISNIVVAEVVQNPASSTTAAAVYQVLRVERSADAGTTWATVPGLEGTTGTPSATQFSLRTHSDTVNPLVYQFVIDNRNGGLYRVVAQPPSLAGNNTFAVTFRGFNQSVARTGFDNVNAVVAAGPAVTV